MFKYLISIHPLGLMYGCSGAFLAPENLVGRSGRKFPPEAATLSGLIFGINKEQQLYSQIELRDNLVVGGPFWAESNNKQDFYVPIPWHKIIGKKDVDEWFLENGQWQRKITDIEPEYQWQRISTWDYPTSSIKSTLKNSRKPVAFSPWQYSPFLHPDIQTQQRCVKIQNGLFLENAVQLPDNICLIYLSTYPINPGWYRFGGENHIVEIECEDLGERALKLFNKPIDRAFAFIAPGVWGSTRFSHRFPQHQDFPESKFILTDKPINYRYRAKKQLGRGRYAVPAGSVFVLDKPLEKSWWEWDKKWFPDEGISLKNMGCGLCLPVEISNKN
jgi:CRISPR-associated protein Cmr3